MDNNFNLGSLKVVVKPLMDHFKKIEENLMAQNLDGSKQSLGKIKSIFKMLGIAWGNRVFELMVSSLEYSENIEVDKKEKIIELDLIILRKIKTHIDNLVDGEKDNNFLVVDEYLKLGELINQKIDRSDLFFPKMDLNDDIHLDFINKIDEQEQDKLISSIRKIKNNDFEFILEKLDNYSTLFNDETKNKLSGVIEPIVSEFRKLNNFLINKDLFIVLKLNEFILELLDPNTNNDFKELIINEKNVVSVLESHIIKLKFFINDLESECEKNVKEINLSKDLYSFFRTSLLNILAIKKCFDISNNSLYINLNRFVNIDKYNSLHDFKVSDINYDVLNLEETKNSLIKIKESLMPLINKNITESIILKNRNIIKENIQTLNKDFHVLNNISIIGDVIVQSLDNLDEYYVKEISSLIVLIEDVISNIGNKKIVNDLTLAEQFELQNKRIIAVINKDISKLEKMKTVSLSSNLKTTAIKNTKSKIYEKMSSDLAIIEESVDKIIREEEDLHLTDSINKLNSLSGLVSTIKEKELSIVLKEIVNIWKKVELNELDFKSKEFETSIKLLSGVSLFSNAVKNGNIEKSENIKKQVLMYFNPELLQENKTEQKNNETVNLTDQVEETIENTKKQVEEPKINKESKIKKQDVVFVDKVGEDLELFESFVEETVDVLSKIKLSCKLLKDDLNNSDEIKNLKRHFHTIKGSGRMVELLYIGEVAWFGEQLLNDVVSGVSELTMEKIELFEEMLKEFMNVIDLLQDEKKAKVDVIYFFNESVKIKESLETQIQFNEEKEIIKEEGSKPIIKSEVENKNNKHQENQEEELSSDELFKVEAKELIKNIIQEFKNKKISKNLMRFCHTLYSLAATKEYNNLSIVSRKIEEFANKYSEKTFVSDDVNDLIEIFESFNFMDFSIEILSDVNDILLKIEKEFNIVIEDPVVEIVEESKPQENLKQKLNKNVNESNIDVKQLMEQISGIVEKAIDNKLSKVNSSIDEIKKESKINVKELTEDIIENVSKIIDEKIDKQNEVNKKTNESLIEKISKLEEIVEDLSNSHKKLETSYRKNMSGVKSDIKTLSENLKKKDVVSQIKKFLGLTK